MSYVFIDFPVSRVKDLLLKKRQQLLYCLKVSVGLSAKSSKKVYSKYPISHVLRDFQNFFFFSAGPQLDHCKD